MEKLLIVLLYVLFFLILILLQMRNTKRRSFAKTESFFPMSFEMTKLVESKPLPRVLQLVLYSPNAEYGKMKDLTQPFYKGQGIRTIYYCYSPDIEGDYQLKDDVLYFKGNETYHPGITEKTFLALEHFLPEYDNYDYVVRSNSSTIINYKLLLPYLMFHPIQYGAGYVNHLYWIDPMSNITDSRYWGTRYGSGTSIILSTELLKKLFQKPEAICKEVIDDLAIGLSVKNLDKTIHPTCLLQYFYFSPTMDKDISKEITPERTIFYRNRCSENRSADVRNMKIIIDRIEGKE